MDRSVADTYRVAVALGPSWPGRARPSGAAPTTAGVYCDAATGDEPTYGCCPFATTSALSLPRAPQGTMLATPQRRRRSQSGLQRIS